MKVIMILDGLFPPDERVEKEAKSLMNQGHEVHMLCLSYKNYSPIENYKGIRIYRFAINHWFRNKLLGLYLLLPFYKLIWRYQIKKRFEEEAYDVIHLHDLPLSDVCISFKDKYGVKLVFDQHEYYSNWIYKAAHYNTFIGKIVGYLSNWKHYEKKNLIKADLVITVEEPLRQQYLINTRVLPENIIVVPNTPLANVFNATNIDNQIVEKYKSNFVVFYAGGIDSLRGLSTVLAAISLLKERIPRLKFVVAGRIVKPYDFLAEIKRYDVEKFVDYLGWVDVSQIPSYVFASSVCVHVPPATHDEVNMSISTKIYQYMALRKPIIVGQAKLMKKLVEESGVGVSVEESDPDDLAAKLLHYFKHPELLDKQIANYDSIAEKYFWEGTVKPLILAYEKFK